MVNVVVLSRAYSRRDSGGVTKDFVTALRRIADVQVQVVVREAGGWVDPAVDCFLNPIERLLERIAFRRRVKRIITRALERVGLPSPTRERSDARYAIQTTDETIDFYSTARIIRKFRFKPDIIFVLITHGTFTYRNLYEMHERTRALIYIMPWDMNPLTGGCHYAWECEGFKSRCGRCPAIYSKDDNDQSRKNWLYKKFYIKAAEMRVLCANSWIEKKIRESALMNEQEIRYVGLPIDDAQFSSGGKMASRERFGIPVAAKVIFFGAVSIADPRKGFALFRTALGLLRSLRMLNSESEVIVLIAGKASKNIAEQLPFPIINVGPLTLEELPQAFRAADVFVCPTIQDAGPMMINQSLLCGSPVVSFEMGCALDLVKNGETGYRAPVGDCTSLALGIATVLNLSEFEWSEMSANCRSLGVATNSIDTIAFQLRAIITSVKK